MRNFVAFALVFSAACGSRDLQKDIRLVDVQTGWIGAESPDGQNKIVPSVSLKIENVSTEPINGIQFNAIFRRVGEQEVWGEHFIQAQGREDLAPGSKGKTLVLRSRLGYTGSESRQKLLDNKEFVDTHVNVFGKHGSRTWVKVGEFQIDRRLLAE